MKMITKEIFIYNNYSRGRSSFHYRYLCLSTFILLLANINMVSAASSPDFHNQLRKWQKAGIKHEAINTSEIPDTGTDNPSKITFSLYNAKTGKPVAGFNPIAEGAVINLAKVGKDLDIVMHVRGIEHIGSVKLGYNKSRNYQLEEQAPYAINLDYTVESDESKYNSWAPVLGDNQVAATVYAEARAKGNVLSKASIRFKVIEEEVAPEETDDLSNIVAYPNPTVNEIHIAVKDNSQATFKIVDPAGAVVKSGKITESDQVVSVDVQDLKTGLYYIRMLTETGVSIKKIFIKK